MEDTRYKFPERQPANAEQAQQLIARISEFGNLENLRYEQGGIRFRFSHGYMFYRCSINTGAIVVAHFCK